MKSAIIPVSIFPTVANQLEIDDSWAFTGTPRLNYRLQNNAHDEASTLIEGLVNLTHEQWAAWTTQSDDTYLLQCAATNLGLTLIH